MRRFLLVWILLVVIISACRQIASPTGTIAPDVLASTTFLADIAQHIAGDQLTVESLLPTNADPHSYQPSPRDIVRISQSRLILINGAGYETFIEPLLENAKAGTEVIEASAGVIQRKDALDRPLNDPHMWLDPNNVMIYVENIREALTHLDPDHAEVYRINAESYVIELMELNDWITDQVSQIPKQRRLLVTNHESLGYFAQRYGFTVTGTLIEGFSSSASPSAGQVVELIELIQSSGASAVFLDAADNDALAQQIAEETGVRVVTGLHLESLTEGPPAGSYIDMMKYNVTLITESLK